MSDEKTIHVVMANPPESRANYAVEGWEKETTAESRAENIPFGYVDELRLNEEHLDF